jgi:hypothetical protein
MTALMIKAINVPRMTRVTWYKHRASVLGIPGLFLLAAALLFIDSVLQRHWISSHHLTYCLAYADNATSSRCLTRDSPYLLGGLRGVRQLLADGRHRGGGIPAGCGDRLVCRSAVGGPRVRGRRLPVHLDPECQSASLAARHVRTAHPARRGNRRDLRCRHALMVSGGAVAA